MIDLSDGLLGDAGHLAAASGVRCALELERVPVHPTAGAPSDALVSGEEYELLVAMSEDFGERDATEFRKQFDLPLTRIGVARRGQGVVVLGDGEPMDIGDGFQQF
jgi:thiamine-monophosphate kinase